MADNSYARTFDVTLTEYGRPELTIGRWRQLAKYLFNREVEPFVNVASSLIGRQFGHSQKTGSENYSITNENLPGQTELNFEQVIISSF